MVSVVVMKLGKVLRVLCCQPIHGHEHLVH